ncbi:MAG: hypothetical protein QNK04_16150 [Myxococcota bacterium]|nr:hypothetical protein [Myxococcota bacterium]
MGEGGGAQPGEPRQDPDGRFRCDFCGEAVPRVRRIALDRGYERLQTPHAVQYACERCSEEKESQRRGSSA